jgi:hypothetical protein
MQQLEEVSSEFENRLEQCIMNHATYVETLNLIVM